MPEHTTDFIFAVLAEEFGWIGVVTVLALYAVIIGRCLWIAAESRDAYARILSGGVALALFVYVVSTAAWSPACCRWWAYRCRC